MAMADDLFSVGIRNVENAYFLKSKILPIMAKNEKWCLTVSECHRITEILLSGMILLLGGSPKQRTRNLEGLVQKLQDSISASKGPLGFEIGLYGSEGRNFGIRLNDGGLLLLEECGETFIVRVGHVIPSGIIEGGAKIAIGLSDYGEIVISIDGKSVLSYPAEINDTRILTEIRRNLRIDPSRERLKKLKNIGKHFTHSLLLDSRYSERKISKEEARFAMERVESIFATSEELVSIKTKPGSSIVI